MRRKAEEPDGTWESLDRRFRAPLSAYFVRRVQDRGEADELTREVFTRLIRNPAATPGETPEAHVFKIASSVLQDWSRYGALRHADSHRVLTDVTETLGTPSVPVEERARNMALAAREALRDLEEALSGLGRRTREIFLLSRVENVPHPEIARQYGISEATVKKHVLKAMVHLSAKAFKS